MNFSRPRLGRLGSRHRRVWLCYYLAFVLIHVTCFHTWLMVLTPNRGRPLGVHAAYAWGWVWINTRSGIYRHPGARWWGTTQQGKYRPEWFARLEGDRETRNGQ